MNICEMILATTAATPSGFMQFLVLTASAALGTGLFYGIVYVLLMRALRMDRKRIENWFEHKRLRLQAGPIPVIETVLPGMLWVLHAVYGRGIKRRMFISLLMALLFTTVTFVVLANQYRHVPDSVRKEKAVIEREVDPRLYKYATDPALASEYFKVTEIAIFPGDKKPAAILKYPGGIYQTLRDSLDNYDAKLSARLIGHLETVNLTLLLLFEGCRIFPGFRWTHSILLFFFNAIVDFVSISLLLYCLNLLTKNTSFGRAILLLTVAFVGTTVCFCIAFVSYHVFFQGNTGLFRQILFDLPTSLLQLLVGLFLLAILVGLIIDASSEETKGDRLDEYFSIFVMSIFLLPVSGFFLYRSLGENGVQYLWSYWKSISFAGLYWSDLIKIPYILAGTTLMPATLALTAFVMMVAIKASAEPARIVPEAYMTFVKEEMSGTQAAGLIAVLGIITGALFALISSI